MGRIHHQPSKLQSKQRSYPLVLKREALQVESHQLHYRMVWALEQNSAARCPVVRIWWTGIALPEMNAIMVVVLVPVKCNPPNRCAGC
jgi:hypothetical protein